MSKVVLFINSLSIGGAERQACILADGLVERGYDVTLTTYGNVSDFYTYNPKVHRNQIAPGGGKLLKMISIWRYFLTVKTDWVISFGQRSSSFCLRPLMFRSRKKIRVIASERNTTIGKPGTIEKQLMRSLYHRVDYIVPNSFTQREHIIKAKTQYKDKTIAITNYTDTSKFKPTPLPGEDLMRIGVFSRYAEQKNCVRFVEVVKQLKDHSSQRFVIDWYGDRYIKDTQLNPMFERMSQKIHEYGLTDCIKLHDMIRDVVGEMVKFDACCLPSLHEGFSNSVSEAICCGKPCIVSDVADNGIMVKDGVNGFLFDPEKIESMVSAFTRFFHLTKEERQNMGKESRLRAEQIFDLDAFIQKYVNLIES